MSDSPAPNDPIPPKPVNPSVEATKIDDQRAKKLHQEEEIAAGVAGTGLGCLGILLLPWTMVALALLAAVIFVIVMRLAHG
jgi:hypothetical protein